MAIDLYALCPCGSGKKIKFCCRDLAGEIEKIERMLDAGQRQACLEHIEILEKKYPGRPYLATTKAELQRELGRGDEADATLKELLSHEGGNPIARAEAALQALEREDEGGVPTAAYQLQLAIEAAGDQWPERLFEALVAVANHSVAQGRWMTGLGHMTLFAAADQTDEQSRQAIMQFHRSPRVPLIVKEDRWLKECPSDAAWRSRFEEALDLAHSGLWRKAEHEFRQLVEEHPASPVLWHNLALLRAWLADDAGAADALRSYSRLDVPLDDAVEALVLALAIDPPEDDKGGAFVSMTWNLKDMDRAIAALHGDKRLIDRGAAQAEEGAGPPPRAQFLWLDREPPVSPTDVRLDDVPCIVGSIGFFGRETDREARLEAIGVRNEAWEAALNFMDQLLEDAGERGTEQVLGEAPSAVTRQKRRWIPPGTSAEGQERLRAESFRDWALNQWPTQPQSFLGGATLEDAARDEARHVEALALILSNELAAQTRGVLEFDFDEVRRRLGLPVAGTLELGDTPLVEAPLVRLARAPFKTLSEDDLVGVYARASHYDATHAAYRAGQELMERGDGADSEPRATRLDALALVLAQLTDNTSTALRWVAKSREIARAKGASCAQQDLVEMMFRVRRGEEEPFSQLLEHVSEEHLDEPNVRQTLAQILVGIGAVNPDGTPTARAAEAARAEQAPQPGKIWTPGGEPAAAAGEPRKIWTPG